MLAWIGGGLVATLLALLLLNLFVGDLRVEPVLERALQAPPETALAPREG